MAGFACLVVVAYGVLASVCGGCTRKGPTPTRIINPFAEPSAILVKAAKMLKSCLHWKSSLRFTDLS